MSIKSKTNDLTKVRDEIREKSLLIAGMIKTPRYEVEYSQNKLDAWNRDIEKLREKESQLITDIAELKQSPAFLKDYEVQARKLAAKHAEITASLTVAQDQARIAHDAMAEKILEGYEPFELVTEYHAMLENVKRLAETLEAINQASKKLMRDST